MSLRLFHKYEAGSAAYLFGRGGEKKCVVVDPQEQDVVAYIKFAGEKAMRITHVIDTHVHADQRCAAPTAIRTGVRSRRWLRGGHRAGAQLAYRSRLDGCTL
jgi:hypothetical protein